MCFPQSYIPSLMIPSNREAWQDTSDYMDGSCTHVTYQCGHNRNIVKAWCVRYQQTQERYPPNIVALCVMILYLPKLRVC